MRQWLEMQEDYQKKLFNNFAYETIGVLHKIENENPGLQIVLQVDFKKDQWLKGNAQVSFHSGIDFTEGLELGNTVVSYTHSMYDKSEDVSVKSLRYKLMKEGVLTNTWFALLDTMKSYDTKLVFTSQSCDLLNDTYREERFADNKWGFNGIESKVKSKNKM